MDKGHLKLIPLYKEFSDVIYGCPSWIDPSISLEAERYTLGLKVLSANHAPLSQEFLKKGCPHSLRGKIWAQVLGCELTEKDLSYQKDLIQAKI